MNDLELIDRLASTDGYAENRPLPDGWSSTILRTIERTIRASAEEATDSNVAVSTVGRPMAVTGHSRRRWRSSARIAVTAAAIVIAVGVAGFLVRPNEPFNAGASVAVADEFVAAFNGGDAEAVMALFTSDADISFRGYTGEVPWAMDRASYEALVVWWQAQGTQLTMPDCAVTGEVVGASVTMTCRYNTIDGPTRVVGAPPFPSTTTIEITPSGIRAFHQVVGEPDLYWVEAPFERWMQEHHFADREVVYFFHQTTTEEGRTFVPKTRSRVEAAELGRVRAEFAEEWADYLAVNGCDYLDRTC